MKYLSLHISGEVKYKLKNWDPFTELCTLEDKKSFKNAMEKKKAAVSQHRRITGYRKEGCLPSPANARLGGYWCPPGFYCVRTSSGGFEYCLPSNYQQ